MYRKQVRRRRAVLALLIVGSFVLLTITYGQGSDGLQRGVSTIFSPVQAVADRALKPARDLVNWFDKTFDARGENSRLEDELAKVARAGGRPARRRCRKTRSCASCSNSTATRRSRPPAYEPVTGRVIARSPTVWHSTVTIDVGSGDGVDVDDPVINGDGLVGAVAAVTGGSAQVTLITDHASAVSAKVVPIGVQGVIRPDGRRPRATWSSTSSTRPRHVAVGQTVVTSGWRAQGLASLLPARTSRSAKSPRPRSSSRRRASRSTCDPTPTCATSTSSRC